MTATSLAVGAFALAGVAFFCVGTVGLLRFGDVHSRLHALTKADNLGLGLLVAALALHSGSAATAAKLVLVWLLALLAASGASYAVAGGALGPEEAAEEREARGRG